MCYGYGHGHGHGHVLVSMQGKKLELELVTSSEHRIHVLPHHNLDCLSAAKLSSAKQRLALERCLTTGAAVVCSFTAVWISSPDDFIGLCTVLCVGMIIDPVFEEGCLDDAADYDAFPVSNRLYKSKADALYLCSIITK